MRKSRSYASSSLVAYFSLPLRQQVVQLKQGKACLVEVVIVHKSVSPQLFGAFKFERAEKQNCSNFRQVIHEVRQQKVSSALLQAAQRTATELEHRFDLFAGRVKQIAKSKIDYLTGESNFSAAINQFSNWGEYS